MRSPQLDAGQRPAEGRDLRTGLGHPVCRRDRDAGGPRSREQRGRDRAAAEQRPPERRWALEACVEQSGEHRRDERDERRALRRVHQLIEHRLGFKAALDHGRGRIDRAADRDRQAADVRQRHRAQPPFGRIEAERDRRAERTREQVPLGENHRLGRRRRAGGVHHGDLGVAAGAKRVKRVTAFERLGHDDVGGRGTGRALSLGQPKVDRDRGRPRQQAAVQRDHELRTGSEGQRDPRTRPGSRTGPDAARLQGTGGDDRRLREFGIRQAPLRALDRDPVRVFGGGQVDPEHGRTVEPGAGCAARRGIARAPVSSASAELGAQVSDRRRGLARDGRSAAPLRAADLELLGQEVGPDHEHAAPTCATIVWTLGKTANQSPIQPGIAMFTGVVAIQPACWSSWTLSPTITSSTTPSITPVATSILRYGSRRCRPNVRHPIAATNTSPSATPSSTTARAVAQAQVLEEQHDLEALPVDRCEAEQREPEERSPGADRAGAADDRLPATIVVRDPARPVDAMKEPVHDDEQHGDREQSGRGLEVEARRGRRRRSPRSRQTRSRSLRRRRSRLRARGACGMRCRHRACSPSEPRAPGSSQGPRGAPGCRCRARPRSGSGACWGQSGPEYRQRRSRTARRAVPRARSRAPPSRAVCASRAPLGHPNTGSCDCIRAP